jgi:alpha-glucosidase
MQELSCWDTATIYQIYLPSFADSNGDGIGDLEGIEGKLHYLRSLAVTAIWITPFYPSPMHDSGYDVSDHLQVDARYGGIGALDALVASAHDAGLSVITDLVLNHVSDQHEWFLRSCRGPASSKYHDYFHWVDTGDPDKPPNNWLSHFGGPAWTYHEGKKAFYLHLFSRHQPDLNWDSQNVRGEADTILRFWLDRGIDGFRIDVAHGFIKAAGYPDNPPVDAARRESARDFHSQAHVFDHNRPEVHYLFRSWMRIAASYGAHLIGEVNLASGSQAAAYCSEGGLTAAAWFGLVAQGWQPAGLARAIHEGTMASDHIAWSVSNHDRQRAATRFGGGSLGATRSLLLLAALIGIPGILLVYQGDELGLSDVELPRSLSRDAAGMAVDVSRSRDGARTPMPWSAEANLGFTTGDPWLPIGPRSPNQTVQAQDAARDSFLNTWRSVLRLRSRIAPDSPFSWQTYLSGAGCYSRGRLVVMFNLNDHEVAFDALLVGEKVLFTCGPPWRYDPTQHFVLLGPASAVVWGRRQS